jgi:hypothetical protein
MWRIYNVVSCLAYLQFLMAIFIDIEGAGFEKLARKICQMNLARLKDPLSIIVSGGTFSVLKNHATMTGVNSFTSTEANWDELVTARNTVVCTLSKYDPKWITVATVDPSWLDTLLERLFIIIFEVNGLSIYATDW